MKKLILPVVLVTLFVGCATAVGESAKCTAASAANPLKVAVYADKGPSGVGAVEWYRIVNDSPDMTLKVVDGEAVRNGALEGQDMLIMPGGSSRKEFESLGKDGVAKMKDFIRSGGGYVGTCAGCCLLMDAKKGRACVMPWNTCGAERDLLFPPIRINAAGAKALGIAEGSYKYRYHGGPFMWPTTNVIEGANFELWGTFDSDATYHREKNPKRKMYGAAAIVGGTYGKGRVFATSMHPEYFESTWYLVKAAIRYVSGREVTLVRPHRERGDLAVGCMPICGSVKNVETMLEMANTKGVDYQVVNMDDLLWTDRIAHFDVLVVPGGVSKTNVIFRTMTESFVARGGKLLTCSEKNSPEGAIVCKGYPGVLEKVKELAK